MAELLSGRPLFPGTDRILELLVIVILLLLLLLLLLFFLSPRLDVGCNTLVDYLIV